jgi:hypothetical protein
MLADAQGGDPKSFNKSIGEDSILQLSRRPYFTELFNYARSPWTPLIMGQEASPNFVEVLFDHSECSITHLRMVLKKLDGRGLDKPAPWFVISHGSFDENAGDMNFLLFVAVNNCSRLGNSLTTRNFNNKSSVRTRLVTSKICHVQSKSEMAGRYFDSGFARNCFSNWSDLMSTRSPGSTQNCVTI